MIIISQTFPSIIRFNPFHFEGQQSFNKCKIFSNPNTVATDPTRCMLPVNIHHLSSILWSVFVYK